MDTVQEFRLIRNHFSAEYGTHSGTVVSVVSKSGTNSIHGTLYEYHRNAALDAAEIFAPFNSTTKQKDKAPLVQNTFGVTVGGPVFQDRVSFFGSYEGFRERTGEPGRFVVETPEFRQWVIQNNPDSFASSLFREFPAPAPTRDILTVADLPPPDQVSFINPVHPPPRRICRCWEELMPLPQCLLIATSSVCGWTVTSTKRRITSSGATTSRMKRSRQHHPGGGFGDDFDARNQSLLAAWTRSFDPNLINEARFGYLYGRTDFVPGSNPEIPDVLWDGRPPSATRLRSDRSSESPSSSVTTPFSGPTSCLST